MKTTFFGKTELKTATKCLFGQLDILYILSTVLLFFKNLDFLASLTDLILYKSKHRRVKRNYEKSLN